MNFSKSIRGFAKVFLVLFLFSTILNFDFSLNTFAQTSQKPIPKTTVKTSINTAVKSSSNKKTVPSRGYYKPVTSPKVSSRGNYSYCIQMVATAYSAPKSAGTASGLRVAVGRIAVDPRVIPLGTKLYIESLDGSKDYGYAVAADTGSAIKNNKVDLFFDTNREACNWGQRSVKVYVYKN